MNKSDMNLIVFKKILDLISVMKLGLFLCYTHFMKTVILCAGCGDRMKPLTLNTPKPLLEIKGKSILFYIFQSLPDEIDEVYLVIKEKHKKLFEDFLTKENINKKVNILFQNEEKRGTYFALLTAKDYLKEDDKFLVLNGDDIFLKEDLEKLIKLNTPCYGLSYKILPSRYRTCDLDFETRKITSFRKQIETDDGKEIPCFSGAFSLNKDFFTYEPVFYENLEAGIPHTLFKNNNNVSFFILKEWIQINRRFKNSRNVSSNLTY